MQQWQWNSPLHNFRPAKMQMANFAASPHLFSQWQNPSSCIAALYVKSKVDIDSKCSVQIHKASATNLPTQVAPDVWILTTPATAPSNTMPLICLEKPMTTSPIHKPIHILKLPMACSATSSNFYLPPRYETPTLDVNISLSMANHHMLNISPQDFWIWQHLGSNRSDMQLQYLTTIPSILIHKIYQHLLNSTIPVMPFNTGSTGNTDSLWILFTHLRIYISAIGSLIPIGIGLFCCYFFWC